ncbi:YraN family protein [Zhihengliuella somnathii]
MGHNQEVGAWGETIAVEFLQGQGYDIVERNWRCRYGEIDIVAQRGEVYAVIEVKTRTSPRCGCAAESVTRQKRQRLTRLAWQWYRERGDLAQRLRVDVVAVDGAATAYTIEHFQGIEA